jgi:hypothetical protein
VTGDEELAALIGVPVGALHRALGTGWTDLGDVDWVRWFVSGRPSQVAVGADGFGFLLARPDPGWDAADRRAWRFVEARRFHADEVLHEPDVLAAQAEEVARRRRRTFRWCPVCRSVNPPEFVHDNTGTCSDCAELVSGVVR